jgi:hypothetical protein
LIQHTPARSRAPAKPCEPILGGVIHPSHHARIYPVKLKTIKWSATAHKKRRQKISDNMIVIGYNDRRIRSKAFVLI